MKILVSLVILFSIIGCTKESMIVTDIDNGKIKSVEQGDLVKIRLKVQPGTGYSWHLTAELKGIKLIKDIGFEGPSENLPGGYEYQSYIIKLVKSGDVKLRMKLNRSWETSSGDEKKFDILFKVK